jgi:hypothetical protein
MPLASSYPSTGGACFLVHFFRQMSFFLSIPVQNVPIIAANFKIAPGGTPILHLIQLNSESKSIFTIFDSTSF